MKISPLWREVREILFEYLCLYYVQLQAWKPTPPCLPTQCSVTSSPFPPHLPLKTIVPSTILSTAFQVNEVDEIVTWQPPAQPNGMIRYYNIRISHVDGTGKEFVVTGVTETTYDFSALGLSMGVYIIQVG